jgi:hypothetical protein
MGSIGDAFVIAEWQDAGGPDGAARLIAPRHLGHSGDEAWYVSEGVPRVQVGKDDIEAGTAHRFSCHGERRMPGMRAPGTNPLSAESGDRYSSSSPGNSRDGGVLSRCLAGSIYQR